MALTPARQMAAKTLLKPSNIKGNRSTPVKTPIKAVAPKPTGRLLPSVKPTPANTLIGKPFGMPGKPAMPVNKWSAVGQGRQVAGTINRQIARPKRAVRIKPAVKRLNQWR